jgi:hypothetical protein
VPEHVVAHLPALFFPRLLIEAEVDQATRTNHESIELCQLLGHPFSIALTHFFAAATAQTCRDIRAAKQQAAVALRIAREQDFRLVAAWALALDGCAAVEEGLLDGIDRIDNALAEVQATGATQFLPYFFGFKAVAYLKHGQPEPGLRAVADAFAVVQRTGERFWEAELHRVKGELLLLLEDHRAHEEAEQCFHQASRSLDGSARISSFCVWL